MSARCSGRSAIGRMRVAVVVEVAAGQGVVEVGRLVRRAHPAQPTRSARRDGRASARPAARSGRLDHATRSVGRSRREHRAHGPRSAAPPHATGGGPRLMACGDASRSPTDGVIRLCGGRRAIRLAAGMQITSGSATLAAESTAPVRRTSCSSTPASPTSAAGRRSSSCAARNRCLTFDARGYGRTTYEPQDGWSAVDDALAVLDAYGVDRCRGHRLLHGWPYVVDLTLLHPERVRALVLIGPAVSGAPEPTSSRRSSRSTRSGRRPRSAATSGHAQPARGPRLARRPDGARGSGRGRGSRPVPGDERRALAADDPGSDATTPPPGTG